MLLLAQLHCCVNSHAGMELELESTCIEFSGEGVSGFCHSLVASVPRLFSIEVRVPCDLPCPAAVVVAFKYLGDGRGELVRLDGFGFGMHGAGPIVVGQDHPEVVCG